MLCFSKYVNDNAEQLRSAFVSHQGKKELVVTLYEDIETTHHWDDFFTLMIDQIKKNTPEGVTAKFECDYSTTQRVQRIFSTAVVMNTYKQYFQYTACCGDCGIQNIHFGGTLEDWKRVQAKTEALVEYDVNGKLKSFVKNVTAILAKFIDTYQGNVDLDFWNKVVHDDGTGGSGMRGPFFSGWLVHLFGYNE
jgi:hypothetical protein